MVPAVSLQSRRLLADCRGTAAIEFGLIAPIFLAMLLGISEFGYQMWTRVSLDYAVAQAARCYALGYVNAASATDCSSLAGAKTYMQTLAVGVRFPAGALTLTNPSSGCLNYSYTATWLLPTIIPMNAPTYTSTSCYYY